MLVIRLFSFFGKYFFSCVFLTTLCGVSAWGSAPAVPAENINGLIAQLGVEDKKVRTRAMYALRLQGQSALPHLLKAYQNGDAVLRRGSVAGLTLLPAPALALDTLLLALEDTDVGARSLAAQGLSLIGPRAASSLVERLASDASDVRNAAAFALKRMGRAAVPALAAGLQTDNEHVRAKIAWILGRIGPEAKAALPALIRVLAADDLRVLHVVAEAIDLIGPPPAETIHHLVLLNVDTGHPALRVGGNAAPTLIRLLTRPGTPLAQLAFHALAAIGKPALPALGQGAQSGLMGKRMACAILLLEIDPDSPRKIPQDVLAAIRFSQQHLQQ